MGGKNTLVFLKFSKTFGLLVWLLLNGIRVTGEDGIEDEEDEIEADVDPSDEDEDDEDVEMILTEFVDHGAPLDFVLDANKLAGLFISSVILLRKPIKVNSSDITCVELLLTTTSAFDVLLNGFFL